MCLIVIFFSQMTYRAIKVCPRSIRHFDHLTHYFVNSDLTEVVEDYAQVYLAWHN